MTCEGCTSGVCIARNVPLSKAMRAQCSAGNGHIVDVLLKEIERKKTARAVQPKATSGPRRRSCSTSKRGKCTDCSNAGTLMMAAIQADTGQPVSCGSCKAYLLSLNRTSTHDHAAIVQKLFAEISWPPHWRATHGDKEGQRKRIAEIVSGVLASATTACPTPRPQRQQGPQRPPRKTVDRKSIPAVSRQPLAQIVPRPFTAKPRLTLLFHCWPNGDSWMRHVDYLRPVSGVFDRKIMGVATGPGTATMAEVRAAFGDSWEYLEVTNDKTLREVLTYRTMLEMVRSADENDVTFCLHSKGAQSHTAASRQIQWWTEAMYSTVAHNWQGVLSKMEQGYPVAGSFLRVGKHLQTRYGWHFSGTFYAFRNAVAFQKGVPGFASNFYGTESWVGHHFARHEAACMFAENCGDIYKENPQLELELNEWRRLNET